MLRLKTTAEGVLLPVKVVPGASRTRIMGVSDGRLRIAVAAPPEKGKANQALTEFLAKTLSLRKRDVTVIAGDTSAIKTVLIAGGNADEILAALQPD